MTKTEFLDKLYELQNVLSLNQSGPVCGTFGMVCAHFRGLADEDNGFTDDKFWRRVEKKNFFGTVISLADLRSGQNGNKFLEEPAFQFFADLCNRASQEWGFQI